MSASPSVPVELTAVLKAPAHLAGALLRGDLARLFQRGGALLRDLELLRLHRLARLQREQLVGGLRRLQRTDG